MSAAETLKQARAADIQVRIDGEALVLEASAPPPPEALELLARYKTDILKLLRCGNDRWSSEDWQNFFEERAAVAEHCGRMTREAAEASALSCCVTEWVRRNPVRSLPGLCAACGLDRGWLQPYVTDLNPIDIGHTWLHQACSKDWHDERRQLAIMFLKSLNIDSLSKGPNGELRSME
jgi:hypothetical protein